MLRWFLRRLAWYTVVAVVAALSFLIVVALAQEHHHPPQDADLHDRFYAEWMMPNDGKERRHSCCNKHDCYPTPTKNVGGTWFALRREDGEWIPVPVTKIEQNQTDPRESPDHQSHVCMPPPGYGNGIYCFTLGVGG